MIGEILLVLFVTLLAFILMLPFILLVDEWKTKQDIKKLEEGEERK
jgi:hypothetical protein